MSAAAWLVSEPIDTARVVASVSGPAHGALLLFVGTVRDVNDGRAVTGIEYSAYEAMAARELADIAAEGQLRIPGGAVAIVHRLGTLALTEASVAVAVAHAHRGEAYDLSRWVIEELKRRVPIWKREHYTDGSREWVDPTGASAGMP